MCRGYHGDGPPSLEPPVSAKLRQACRHGHTSSRSSHRNFWHNAQHTMCLAPGERSRSIAAGTPSSQGQAPTLTRPIAESNSRLGMATGPVSILSAQALLCQASNRVCSPCWLHMGSANLARKRVPTTDGHWRRSATPSKVGGMTQGEPRGREPQRRIRSRVRQRPSCFRDRHRALATTAAAGDEVCRASKANDADFKPT